MATLKSREETNREKQNKLALQKRFSVRITIARQGREYFLAKDYINAFKKYNEYLSILAQSKEQEDIYSLSPALFDKRTQITELLLISHIYWEIARINEMTPKLQPNFQKALNQFVKFTINQPFQVVNSEMLRKYIKKNKKTSRQLPQLNQAYLQIQMQSKKCFIASMCLGQDHPETMQLRIFKNSLLSTTFGLKFVGAYYRISSRVVYFLKHHEYLKAIVIFITRPLLLSFSKLTRTSIFKRCIYYLK